MYTENKKEGFNMTIYEVQYGAHPTKAGQPFRVKAADFSGDGALDEALQFFDKVKRTAERSTATWTISIWERYQNGAPRRWLVKSETINPTGIVG